MTTYDLVVLIAFGGGMALGVFVGWLEWGHKYPEIEPPKSG